MRMFAFMLLIAAVSLGEATAQAPPKRTPEQEKKFEECRAKIREAQSLENALKWKEAIALVEEILPAIAELQGENHADYLYLLDWLGQMQLVVEDYKVAQKTWTKLATLRAKVLGKDHWQTVDAELTAQDAEIRDKLTVDQRKLLLKTRQMGRDSIELQRRGKYREAIENTLEAMRIIREILGEQHIDYAATLNNLALLYSEIGQFAKAEPLFQESLRIGKKAMGANHPDYASAIGNVGLLYMHQGLFTKAEPLFEESLRIRKNAYGEMHPDYAIGLSNLAGAYEEQREFNKAEPLYAAALAILAKAKDKKNREEYANVLNNAANLHVEQGNRDKAEPLLMESLRIRKEVLGAENPSYAIGLNNLAAFYSSQREYVKAETLYAESLRIRKEIYGEKNPRYATALNNLANNHRYLDRPALAEAGYRRATEIIQSHLEESAAFLSEADQLRHVEISRTYLTNYLALREAKAEDLYAAVFRWHGAVTARQTFARAASLASPETRASIEQLRDISRRMNQLVQNPPKGTAKAEQVKAIKQLDNQRETLEKNIAAQSKDFAEYQSHLKLTPISLQKSLPGDTAMLDFLVHEEFTSIFVITKKSIVRIQLETGKDLADEITAFTADLSLMRTRPVTNPDDISAKLRKRIWEPLEPHLDKITRVLICPDGPLCRLPFAALPGADPKKYLLEELSIVVVPVPQLLPGLLAVDAKKFTGAPSLLAVGDVDFDGDPAAGEKPTKPLPVALTRSGNGLSWSRLKNTKGEIETIEGLFSKLPQATVKKFLGNDATEAAIERELSRHSFVHLATHGFFNPPKMVRQFREDQAVGGEKILLPTIPPGLSSGIVCAGANKPTFQVSGVITATQIAELDLRNVELAVLSACETSLGELSGGEGVLGLQRAFQMAGARSTITTMWAIPDQSTAELMKRMYSNRLENGLAAAEALREAQLWVLNNGEKVGAFDQKPTGSKRTPPKFWAAFSFAGDWR